MDYRVDIIVEILTEYAEPFYEGDINFIRETEEVIMISSGDYGFTISKSEYLSKLREKQLIKLGI